MAKRSLIQDAIQGLPQSAQDEALRLWKMKDSLPYINESTVNILVLYCGVWAEAQELTLRLQHAEINPDPDDETITYDYDDTIARLEKVQKLLLSYAKILKLDAKPVKASRNKYFEILTK